MVDTVSGWFLTLRSLRYRSRPSFHNQRPTITTAANPRVIGVRVPKQQCLRKHTKKTKAQQHAALPTSARRQSQQYCCQQLAHKCKRVVLPTSDASHKAHDTNGDQEWVHVQTQQQTHKHTNSPPNILPLNRTKILRFSKNTPSGRTIK